MADRTPAEIGALFPPQVTLDLTSITLGEMATLEAESGRSFDQLIATRATRKIVALWMHGRRELEKPPRWHELMTLRLADLPSSTSPSPSPAGASETSSD